MTSLDRHVRPPLCEAPLIVLGGPTATGKSALAQTIAEHLDGEILSADSMQIYRGMDIGTSKVLEKDRRVPHFGLDLIDPGEPYSAALYQIYGRAVIEDIRHRGKRPILVGGTGFYIRSVVDDYRFAPGEQKDNAMRERYAALARTEGVHAVWDELERMDPVSAQLVHPHNLKRVIRALEMHAAGESYAKRVAALQHIPQTIPAVFLGLAMERSTLYGIIDERVIRMKDEGLVDEVSSLLEQGFREGLCAQQAIGYKEVVSALDGNITMDEAFEQIQRSTRRYAKRQLSWFGQDERYHWFDAQALHDGSTKEYDRLWNFLS